MKKLLVLVLSFLLLLSCAQALQEEFPNTDGTPPSEEPSDGGDTVTLDGAEDDLSAVEETGSIEIEMTEPVNGAFDTVSADAEILAAVEPYLSAMTPEEKVCQLFFVTPESISGSGSVTRASGKLEEGLRTYPVGGVILFAGNLRSRDQVKALNEAMSGYAVENHGIGLLIGVDEEGGNVARIANNLHFKDRIPAMYTLGKTGDTEMAYKAGAYIGNYLRTLNFNLDFAPVADVRSKTPNTEITTRAFSFDAEVTADMVAKYVEGLQEQHILSVLKHFPGHGNAVGNSHNGTSVNDRTIEEFRTREWLPFVSGIRSGAQVVMVSHQTAPAIDGNSPASLSKRVITDCLRGELGFTGVVTTDALRMKAVTRLYKSGEACVRALEAGVDMLLMPSSFKAGYEGVLEALASGRITEARIDESVRRILCLKYTAGLLNGSH